MIIFDKFEYEQDGIFDKDHLRFFTIHSTKKMFAEAGFEILKIKRNKGKNWRFVVMNILSLGLLTEFSVFQYLILAKKI